MKWLERLSMIVLSLALHACSEGKPPSPPPVGSASTAAPSVAVAQGCAAIDACVQAMLAAVDPVNKAAISESEANLKKLSKAAKGDGGKARQLYAQGVAESRKGNRPAAIKLLKQASEADPTDAVILDNLALLHIYANDFEAARKVIHAGLAADPGYAELWSSLSLAMTLAGKKDEAVRALLLGYHFEKDRKNLIAQWEANLPSMNDDSRFVFTTAMAKIKDAGNAR